VAIELDLNGSKRTLEESVVREIHAKAAAEAGSSSTLRDLAFMLERALSEGGPVTLQRAEARALEHLLSEHREQRDTLGPHTGE
jgi:hypothetical protein